jgi:hypothetical protein
LADFSKPFANLSEERVCRILTGFCTPHTGLFHSFWHLLDLCLQYMHWALYSASLYRIWQAICKSVIGRDVQNSLVFAHRKKVYFTACVACDEPLLTVCALGTVQRISVQILANNLQICQRKGCAKQLVFCTSHKGLFHSLYSM